MNFLKNIFLGPKITNEHQKMLELALEKITDVAEKQEMLDKNIVEQGKKIDSIDSRVAKLETLMLENFKNVLTQAELLTERLKTINENNLTIKQATSAIPIVRRLVTSINEQIKLTPIKNVELDDMPEAQKVLIAMVKEVEKVTDKSKEELEKFFVKKLSEKKSELNNQLVKSLKALQYNLERAVGESSAKSKNHLYELERSIKNATRNPASRNTYL